MTDGVLEIQPNPKLSVSVVIPVHNGGESFQKCLLSLRHLLSIVEIVVVADGDSDGSWRFAHDLGVTVLKNEVARGPAHARNLGAKNARGDILFFVDADVTVAPDAISQLISLFENDPELVAVIGSYDDSPGAENFLSQYKNLFHHYTHQMAQEEASTFWGACGAIRRDIFLKLDGFDETYTKPSVEDIELGYRLRKAGYKIRLCKTLQVKHLKRWQVGSLLRAEFFYRALPWTELILRDRQFINDLNLKTSSRVSVVLIYGLLAVLAIGVWWSASLYVAVGLALALLILNWPVYRFFAHKRGVWFALRVVFWHWLYFFYSGLAFAVGTFRYHLQSHKPSQANLSQV